MAQFFMLNAEGIGARICTKSTTRIARCGSVDAKEFPIQSLPFASRHRKVLEGGYAGYADWRWI